MALCRDDTVSPNRATENHTITNLMDAHMHIHTLLLVRAVTDQFDSNIQFSGNVSLLIGDALALPLLDVDSEGGLEVDSGLRRASGISSVDDVTVENGAVQAVVGCFSQNINNMAKAYKGYYYHLLLCLS